MGLKQRMFLAFFILTLVTVVVAATGIVSMLLLERTRDGLLTGDATNEEIIAASQQHILFTSCVMLGIFAVGVILALIFAIQISRSIRLPIERILTVVEQVGETGDLDLSDEIKQEIRDDGAYHDETGRLSRGFARMMDGILDKVAALEVAATGDLTRFAPAVSENDTLANATNTLVSNLNALAREVRVAADQLSTGISQISQGAQSLAQSTMEQTATMETLMNTIREVSTQTEDNTARSKEASDISTAIWSSAEEGRDSMDKMTQAMDEINAASQSISAVMKAIDDIAFQTNILSLNAAVEAARAGQHGRGFAVVADEVRNLATKSASAAEDTNELIADTMAKSGMGMDIVKDTSEYLNKIMNSVSDNTWILKNIATSTAEQNEAIKAINKGFEQLTSVVHQNSATAEESAAATEQMSSQTDALIDLVGRFKVDEDAEIFAEASHSYAVGSTPVDAVGSAPVSSAGVEFAPIIPDAFKVAPIIPDAFEVAPIAPDAFEVAPTVADAPEVGFDASFESASADMAGFAHPFAVAPETNDMWKDDESKY
jgi:methyl-accepting chemotaxis protein